MEQTNWKRYDPKKMAYVSARPCGVCGVEVATAGTHLSTAFKCENTQGFYVDLYIRLCGVCIDSAKESLAVKGIVPLDTTN